MQRIATSLLVVAAFGVAGCANQIAGDSPNQGVYGLAAAHNERVQIAYGDPVERLRALNAAFKAAAPDTVTFEFDQSGLDETARRALDQQAGWLKANKSVRVAVIGHTDLVGGEGYNNRLGMQRARAAANYLVAKGISRKRIDVVESRGERDPVIQTEERERRNRRSVTEVVGFDFSFVGTGLDGEYAQRVYDRYQAGQNITKETDSTDVESN